MDHLLDNCRLKIAGAKKQVDSLRDEIKEFAEDNPCTVNTEVDPETGDELVEVIDPPTFPGDWGITFGQIAYGTRSALDHLIGAFLRKAGREPHGDTAFPISKTESRYLRKNRRGVTYRDRLMRGVPDAFKERIDDLQPYKHGYPPEQDPLFVLSQVANRDEHRESYSAYVFVMTPRRAFGFPGDIELKRIAVRFTKKGRSEVEADFKGGAVLTTPPLTIQFPHVNVKRPTGIEPVFGGQRSQPLTLDDMRGMVDYVDRIIESFAGDLEPASG